MMMNVILYFGSFNPIHTAHMAIASHMANLSDEVWLVLSPHNPIKDSSTLANEDHRLKMANDAIQAADHRDKIKVCTIEFTLPRPSYTYQTLRELRETYKDITFSIAMGSDNLQTIERWRNYEEILEQTHLYIYPRDGYSIDKSKYTLYNITYLDDVKKMAISSTNIRSCLESATDILPITREYITQNNLYK